jgi:hypothetical protein
VDGGNGGATASTTSTGTPLDVAVSSATHHVAAPAERAQTAASRRGVPLRRIAADQMAVGIATNSQELVFAELTTFYGCRWGASRAYPEKSTGIAAGRLSAFVGSGPKEGEGAFLRSSAIGSKVIVPTLTVFAFAGGRFGDRHGRSADAQRRRPRFRARVRRRGERDGSAPRADSASDEQPGRTG